MRMPTRHIVPWTLAALAMVVAGCIERAPTPRERRNQFERGRLSDVLLREPPAPAYKLSANFGGAAEFIGVDVSPQRPRPGEVARFTFYFRVLDVTDDDYKVFVHAEDRGGRLERLNGDHWPAQGRYPTSAWRRGDVIRDVWTLKIPGYYQAEALNIWTGFYIPSKDERWPLVNRTEIQNDGQNRVLAATIPMAGSAAR